MVKNWGGIWPLPLSFSTVREIMIEPSSLEELSDWLEFQSASFGFRVQLPAEYGGPNGSAQTAFLWLFQTEEAHRSAIEQAAQSIWLHEEGAWKDLPRPPAECLLLRIQAARDLIRELIAGEEPLFAYPQTTFREIVEWLMNVWWKTHGIYRASQFLFLDSLRENNTEED